MTCSRTGKRDTQPRACLGRAAGGWVGKTQPSWQNLRGIPRSRTKTTQELETTRNTKNTRFFEGCQHQAKDTSVLYVKTRNFCKACPGRAPHRAPRAAPGSPFLYVRTRGFGHTRPQRVPRDATKHQHKLTNTKKNEQKGSSKTPLASNLKKTT